MSKRPKSHAKIYEILMKICLFICLFKVGISTDKMVFKEVLREREGKEKKKSNSMVVSLMKSLTKKPHKALGRKNWTRKKLVFQDSVAQHQKTDYLAGMP